MQPSSCSCCRAGNVCKQQQATSGRAARTWMLKASSRSLAVMGSMLKMRHPVKSARDARSAAVIDQGTLGRQAYTWIHHDSGA